MTYITQVQLENRYGAQMVAKLTDRAVPATGLLDAATLAQALADTAAMIDGYLQGRYHLPLASVPPLLTDLAGAIAVYKLHRTMAPEKVRTDYEDARRQLEAIAKGVIRLSVAGVEPASGSADAPQTNTPERPFSPASLKGFI